ncbi:MAG: transcriptional repressor, CopY family [Firmicutes bacterium]|nr:transcriptional repressor, CopY family [Bacillota bacterium]
MKPIDNTLSVQQLEIMKVVWRLGEATVRDVYEALRGQRSIAYTTVMTTMKTMEARGHLKKQADRRAFVYQATEPYGSKIAA